VIFSQPRQWEADVDQMDQLIDKDTVAIVLVSLPTLVVQFIPSNIFLAS